MSQASLRRAFGGESLRKSIALALLRSAMQDQQLDRVFDGRRQAMPACDEHAKRRVVPTRFRQPRAAVFTSSF